MWGVDRSMHKTTKLSTSSIVIRAELSAITSTTSAHSPDNPGAWCGGKFRGPLFCGELWNCWLDCTRANRGWQMFPAWRISFTQKQQILTHGRSLIFIFLRNQSIPFRLLFLFMVALGKEAIKVHNVFTDMYSSLKTSLRWPSYLWALPCWRIPCSTWYGTFFFFSIVFSFGYL